MINAYLDFYNHIWNEDILARDEFEDAYVEAFFNAGVGQDDLLELSDFLEYKVGERLAPPIGMGGDLMAYMIQEELDGFPVTRNGMAVHAIIEEMRDYGAPGHVIRALYDRYLYEEARWKIEEGILEYS